jgi:hypothetical protein
MSDFNEFIMLDNVDNFHSMIEIFTCNLVS